LLDITIYVGREHFFLHEGEMFFFPEKTCQVGGYGIQHPYQFFTTPIILDHPEILVETTASDLTHPLAETGADQFLFPVMQVDATALMDQFAELLEAVIG
jgi:hypothetical protein